MKKIVIAPDSFKGTMSALEVCEIMTNAIAGVSPETEVVRLPVADGGEGTVDAYLYALGGEKKYKTVHGPFMRETNAYYGMLDDGKTAVIEMAQASGLPLVGGEKNAPKASSIGTGELIQAAMENGAKRIVLGLGGSATTDGGIGAFAALGANFLDKKGYEIEPSGNGLSELSKVDVSSVNEKLKNTEIIMACDVDNPLLGENGAAHVYGPQKGATPKEVLILEKNLRHYAKVLETQFGQDFSKTPGTGAAGGLAMPFMQFAGAKIVSGVDAILALAKFDEVVTGADFVLTGEGKMDGQSLRGKVPIGVARRCQKKKVPVIAIVGSTGRGIENIYKNGISAVFSTIREAVPFEIAKKTCREDLFFTVESLMRALKVLAG